MKTRNPGIIAGLFMVLSALGAQEQAVRDAASPVAEPGIESVPLESAVPTGIEYEATKTEAIEDAKPNVENAVGITLDEVFALYGQPDTVHAVRGIEEWQDDVVFVYDDRNLDVYLYKDRVWQVCVEAALGVKKGDQKRTALRVLGELEDKGDHLIYRYPATVWPKYARLNLDALDRVSAIYIYRPDM